MRQAVQDKIATGSELIKRNIRDPENGDQGFCPFCNLEVETVAHAHLFLHCSKTWRIWSQILERWGMVWVCPTNLFDLLCWWFSNKFKYVEKGCWEICFYAGMVHLAGKKSDHLQKNKAYEEGLLVEIIKTQVAVWLKACYDLKEYSVEDIKRSIQSIRKLKVSKILVD